MRFIQKLEKIVWKNNSLLCIGLDPDLDKMPVSVRQNKQPLFKFNQAIIKATYDLVCAYKLNSAFYEALGSKGIWQLKMTCDYIRENFPDIPIILDFKRGDIGSTNEAYAKYAFAYLSVDGVTLQPYQGLEALKVFFEQKDKGIMILCRTSNPGAKEFQDQRVNNNQKLYIKLAKDVIRIWNYNQNCFLVVAATYAKELKLIRKLVGDMTLLVPGIGVQGGDLRQTLSYGLNSKKQGLILNVGRSIIYASHRFDFADKARAEAEKLRNEINKYRL